MHSRDDGYHTFVEFPPPLVLPGIIVPQAGDNHLSRSDSLDVFPFIVKNATSPGVRLGGPDVQQQLKNLDDKPVRLLHDTDEFVIRILWPGYPPWERRRTMGKQNVQIPLSTFGNALITMIQQYFQEMANRPSAESRPDWWLSGVSLDSLVLLEVRRTGPGTWQPVLCRVI